MTKIVFFDVKPYDKQNLEASIKNIKEIPTLESSNIDVVFLTSKLNNETVELAKNADIVSLFVHDRLDKEIISKLKCKLVVCRSSGFDHIDLDECTKKGIKVTNVPCYSPNSTAEFAVGLTINLARQLRMAFDRSKNGDFTLTAKLLGFEMRGKTVGVFGTGKIGKIVCEMFSAFKMNVIAFDICEDLDWAAKNGVEYVKSNDEIYTRSDVITLHTPLTQDNYHMINEDAINKMKTGVLIVNTGRGALIDTKALIGGIKSNKIGGVAIDVYENEVNVFDRDWYSTEQKICHDDDLSRLMGFPNVLITSHQAYFTKESLKEIANVTIDNIIEFLEKSTAYPNGNYSLKYELN